MFSSHRSLSVDYEVSTEELDALVGYAAQLGVSGGVLGARVRSAVCVLAWIACVTENSVQHVSLSVCALFGAHVCVVMVLHQHGRVHPCHVPGPFPFAVWR
jgi:galactokinase